MNQPWKAVQSTRPATAGVDDVNAAIISLVAEGSPAQKLGLKAHDRLISIDGQPFTEQEDLDLTFRDSTVTYEFYIRASSTILSIEIDPVPIGIVAAPSSHNLLESLRTDNFPGWEAFHILWKRRDWNILLEASEKAYSNNGISKIIRKAFKNFGKNPGMLYVGIALYEMDREEEGINIIIDFMNSIMNTCDTHEQALAYFYLSHWYGLIGHEEASIEYLKEADRDNANYFERISHEVYLKEIPPYVERYKWKGATFPIMYDLSVLQDEHEDISLEHALRRLNDNQLLPVCVMPSYRDNGPYNTAMSCYLSMYHYIADHVAPMHIILDELVTKPGNEWRLTGENSCKKHGVPFHLLHDPYRSVSRALALEFSPVFYFLDKSGTIVYDGNLKTGADYWPIFGALVETH